MNHSLVPGRQLDHAGGMENEVQRLTRRVEELEALLAAALGRIEEQEEQLRQYSQTARSRPGRVPELGPR